MSVWPSNPAARRRRVPLIVCVYALLLWLYPAPFRREYGDEMLRVLHDRVREAENGPGAGMWLWSWALGDLVQSALAERLRGRVSMEKGVWMRVGGAAAMLGGVLFAVESAVSMSSTLSSAENNVGLAGASGVAAAVLAPLLFMGASVALSGKPRGHERWLVLPGCVLVLCGLFALAVEHALSLIAQIEFTAGGLGGSPTYGLLGDLHLPTLLGFYVSPLLILGFALVGGAVLRARPLPFANVLPLALALLYAILFSQWFAVANGVLIRSYQVANVLVGLVWVLLGLSLWQSVAQSERAQVARAV